LERVGLLGIIDVHSISCPLPDAPINVGWGSKQTQFHGSLGKAAAQVATAKSGSSPDDDGLPRISWRGNGAFFVVSSLAPSSSEGFVKRILRVYDRQAALQSTSEDVPGLEHTLVWRPSGNLVASTQRFGIEGGGAGRVERHDVVFFERNGLRHGEFGLRVLDIGGKFKELDSEDERKWGYRVKELAWSSDSNVLSVWIEHDDGDIGTFSSHQLTFAQCDISATLDDWELSLVGSNSTGCEVVLNFFFL